MGYKDVPIPEDKDPEDYTYGERRAALFRYILDAGHPDLINRTQFADHFGVAQSTITADIQKIRDEVRDELGTDADLIIYAIFQRGLRSLAREEDWETAMQFARKWADFLFDRAEADYDKAAQKHEVDAEVRQAAQDSDTQFVVALADELDVEPGGPELTDTELEDLGFAATPNSGDTGGDGSEMAVDPDDPDDIETEANQEG